MGFNTSSHPYIVIAGLMGSGTTTAAKLLNHSLDAKLMEERAGDNNFLPLFYQDMKRWAFQSQLFYLTQKIKQYLDTKDSLAYSSVVQDVPIEQDVEVYAQTQYKLSHITEHEWRLYKDVYELFRIQLPQPDLFVLLEASSELLVLRIQQRGREFERMVSKNYLDALNDAFEEFKNNLPQKKTLVFNTAELDLKKNSAHQDMFVAAVKDKIKMPSD